MGARRRLRRGRWCCLLIGLVAVAVSACSPGPNSHLATGRSAPTPTTRTSTSPAVVNPWLRRRVVAVTHNGGQFEFPQDTVFALSRAHALHMQVLDVDVQMSKDDVPVLIHSETLDSSTNGHGDVSDYTAAQLGRLDAAYQWVPGCGACGGKAPSAYRDRGVRSGAKPLPEGATSRAEFGVPTLEEVFERFPRAYLDVELKPQSDAAPKVAALIRRFHRQSRTIVASFSDQQIAQFQALAPTVATSPGQTASTGFFLGRPVPPGFEVLQLPYRYPLAGQQVTVITPSLVKRAHAAGLAVWVWDEGAPPGKPLYRTLISLGVDGILASSPSQLLSVLHGDHQEWAERS